MKLRRLKIGGFLFHREPEEEGWSHLQAETPAGRLQMPLSYQNDLITIEAVNANYSAMYIKDDLSEDLIIRGVIGPDDSGQYVMVLDEYLYHYNDDGKIHTLEGPVLTDKFPVLDNSGRMDIKDICDVVNQYALCAAMERIYKRRYG